VFLSLFFQIHASEELRGGKIWYLVGGFGGDDQVFAGRFHFYACFLHAVSPDLMCLDPLISCSVLVFPSHFVGTLQIAKQSNISFCGSVLGEQEEKIIKQLEQITGQEGTKHDAGREEEPPPRLTEWALHTTMCDYISQPPHVPDIRTLLFQHYKDFANYLLLIS
jgi:hypothetical protein